MSKYNCKSCQGSGRVRGGGMIEEDCKSCHGTGKDVKAESYANAKQKIKELDKNMSDDEAKKLLDEELIKLDNDDKIVKIKHKRKKIYEAPKDTA